MVAFEPKEKAVSVFRRFVNLYGHVSLKLYEFISYVKQVLYVVESGSGGVFKAKTAPQL